MVEAKKTKREKNRDVRIREVSPAAITRWVSLGWRDLRGAGWPSLMHGAIVFVMSLLIVNIG